MAISFFANQTFDLSQKNASFWRKATLVFYFFTFQLALFSHRPFVHSDLSFHFYFGLLVVSLNHILFSSKKIFSILFDVSTLIFLAGLHPYLASYNLLVVMIILFLSGLELNLRQSIQIAFGASVLLSVTNLTVLRWESLQNIFSLGLFNFSFCAVIYISQLFKNQLQGLENEIATTQVQLRSIEEFSQTLIQNIPMGLSAFTSERQFLFSNKYLSDYLKLDPKYLSDLNFNQSKSVEFSFFDTDLQKKREFEVFKNYYFDEQLNQQVDLMLINDVTEIRQIQDQMRQNEKLAAIGQLAAGIAHEIRNPLAGISGSVELLSREATNSDDQKLMKIILKEIDRLNLLITEFLDYSKPESRPDQRLDLSLVVNEVVINLKQQSDLSSQVDFQIQTEPCTVLGSAAKLKQVILNIAMNALQAMQQSNTKILKIDLRTDSDFVVLKIKDTGTGMTEQVKKRIFEPFFTTKAKGTGLGMAMSHKILQSHEARIDISSDVGSGTEFKLSFKKV